MVLACPPPAAGGEDPPPEAAKPPPCGAPEHRQFDFWLGSWEVSKPDGSRAGVNRITAILGGCALREEWSSEGSPYAGTSYNVYDAARGLWHQTWVDNQGGVLYLEGGLVGEAMVLEGERPGPAGEGGEVAAVRHRITWTPLGEERVRQHWETSKDGGETWSTAFDGLYVRE
jgi:hypothetical protein